MAELTFEIIDHIAVLSEGTKGWTKEVNIVSWNGRIPKVDIREWDETHEKMAKGITLSKQELTALKAWLENTDVEALGLDG